MQTIKDTRVMLEIRDILKAIDQNFIDKYKTATSITASVKDERDGTYRVNFTILLIPRGDGITETIYIADTPHKAPKGKYRGGSFVTLGDIQRDIVCLEKIIARRSRGFGDVLYYGYNYCKTPIDTLWTILAGTTIAQDLISEIDCDRELSRIEISAQKGIAQREKAKLKRKSKTVQVLQKRAQKNLAEHAFFHKVPFLENRLIQTSWKSQRLQSGTPKGVEYLLGLLQGRVELDQELFYQGIRELVGEEMESFRTSLSLIKGYGATDAQRYLIITGDQNDAVAGALDSNVDVRLLARKKLGA